MAWLFGGRHPDDEAAAGGGPRLLIATFGRLLWYFPQTEQQRVVQDGRGKYYGMAPHDREFAKNGRVLVVSRPSQEKNDRLLLLDHRRGKTQSKRPLDSRDTHHAVRVGDEFFVTDTFRGRVLVYALPSLKLTRVYDGFTHENHVNTVLVEQDVIHVLCHNKGTSSMAVVDRGSGDVVDMYEDVGEHSHDISLWRGDFVISDSRGGGLILVDRETKAARTLHADEGHFTKGLTIAGDVAYFCTSMAATREERFAVSCDLLAYDLAADQLLWRRPISSRGLVNCIVTYEDLLGQLGS
jgi:hypothetical protein